MTSTVLTGVCHGMMIMQGKSHPSIISYNVSRSPYVAHVYSACRFMILPFPLVKHNSSDLLGPGLGIKAANTDRVTQAVHFSHLKFNNKYTQHISAL